jgi:hypothetical protein
MSDEGWGSGETTSTHVVGAAGPPPYEFPGVLPGKGLIWRGSEAAVSVVAVYAYTTGLEFALRGFAPRIPVDEIRAGIGGRPDSTGGLLFTVQGQPGTLLRAEYRQHTFRADVWVSADGHGDVVLGAEWPDAGISWRELVVRAEDIDEARRIATSRAGSAGG